LVCKLSAQIGNVFLMIDDAIFQLATVQGLLGNKL
jgi:hypothetical protein